MSTTQVKLFAILLCCFTFANAAKGPEYRSLRVHGMGGAFIGVADGREALYYNPAGLNLKNRFENFEKYPDMGYMPRQRYELRLFTVSVGLPANEIGDVLDVCGAPKLGKIIKKVLFFDFGYLADADWCPSYTDVIPSNTSFLLDSLTKHPELMDNIRVLDRSLIEIGTQISVLEFSMHNFGFAAWVNTSAAPYLERGVIVPGFGYDPVQIDAVVQTGFAFSPLDDWSFGMGLKAARRYKAQKFNFLPELNLRDDIKNPKTNTDELDSIGDFWGSFADDSLANFSFDDINFALDFGVLYQLTREVRLGTSLRNVFFSDLAGESITPNWSIGAAYSPMLLQSNSWWARKVNFAADYTNMLDGTVGSMFLAHFNFGAEIEQVVLPSPVRDMSLSSRLLFGLLGTVVGAGTGYLIGEGMGLPGLIAGLALGTTLGLNVGLGGDLLRTSVGAGFEGGYSAWNVALSLTDAVIVRFGSYAEERGVRTGQKEQRFWTGELSVGF